MQTLRVSENRRFLSFADGRPFFYLGDTAWELFHRLNREDAAFYLRRRAEQGFTVIQAVALAEHEFGRPNPYGHLPLENNDPTRPVEAYFQHVDAIVDMAARLNLVMGMLPTWGDKWNRKWGQGPEFFTPDNARVYGRFLGRRYRDRPILWILGGDRPVETDAQRAIIRAMAAGLSEGDGGRHLMTFHPSGWQSSGQFFPNEDWVDFHMIQSGHSRDTDNASLIAQDYARTPTKPCMDGEPGYEDHPAGFDPKRGYLDDYDVRKATYRALFAGAHGHTYGCHDIWQFHAPGWAPISNVRTRWRAAIDLPGAERMRHAKHLMLSRPFFTRIPDQTLINGNPGPPEARIQATRDAEGRYAFVYTAAGAPFSLNMDRLGRARYTAWWYNPRTGAATRGREARATGTRTFTPPTHGPGQDWVLVLDDTTQPYAPPGRL